MDFEDMLFIASMNEKADRYDEMAAEMRKVIEIAQRQKYLLGVPERSLYSVAFKNVIGQRRASWRVLVTERKKFEEDERKVQIINEYIEKVKSEIFEIADDVLLHTRNYLASIEDPGNEELRVFMMKMIGDYCRYKAEVEGTDELKQEACDVYGRAWSLAREKLEPTNPVRLGLALNRSVFYYEIAKDADAACSMAKQAFDESIAQLDSLSEEHYKDSTLIMQLLRDNLTLWTSRVEDEQQDNCDISAVDQNQ
ncbi:14-3-3 domain [Trinorchestia longiramus]|nr:14-3-3 domain [Trinorchestia longiramus]